MGKNEIAFNSPAGIMRVTERDGAITGVSFDSGASIGVSGGECSLLNEAKRQLLEYFARTRKMFDLPIKLDGTPFQIEVWSQLMEIPYGETRSYADIARAVGRAGASRAVGGANNRNRIAVIVPCHRVIGANGALVGYGAGLDIKRLLLGLEGLSV